MANQNSNQELLNKIKKSLKEHNLEFCQDNESNEFVGKGGFGDVYKVQNTKNNHLVYAAKILTKDVSNNKEPIKDFRGKNIVKINNEIDGGDEYYIYMMEYSRYGNLKKFIKNIDNEKKRRILKEPFLEQIGDNLVRFFVKQMVTGLKSFYIGNLVHFDIKPENLVLFQNLELKFIDFNLLRKIDDEDKYDRRIPGGTQGYTTPEFYSSYEKLDDDTLRSQDYFAIGSTIFYLKYNKPMLSYIIHNNEGDAETVREIKNDSVVASIEEAMNFIKRQKYQDKDFSDFLCSLLQFKPEYRPTFEEIVRNKWLNKNSEEIEKIVNIHRFNESNLLLELQKSDFLINNAEHYRKKYEEKNSLKNSDEKYIMVRKGKFKFGKKIKNKK